MNKIYASKKINVQLLFYRGNAAKRLKSQSHASTRDLSTWDHDFHAVLISGGIEIPGEDVVFEDGFFLCSGTQKEINIQSSGAAPINIQHSDT